MTQGRRVASFPFSTDRLIAALLDDPRACIALLDRQGRVLRRGGGWPGLPAVEASAGHAADDLAALASPVPTLLRRALESGQTMQTDGHVGTVPAGITLTPVRAGRVAGVLRLTDRSREHDLAEALGQAQRLQEVGELAGGIAHDFNNLLTAILGAADDLAAHATEADRPDLTQIRTSATRGADLVRQLLAFSQRQALQPRALVLDEAVAGTASLLRRLLGGRIDLVLELNAPGRMVLMDGTQLDQVLVNLAVNGRNAMKDGGRLTIATGWRVVLTGDDPGPDGIAPGRYATLTIADSGCGMAPDVLKRIFDPFFTTRRGEGGTGLGLSTVRGIVRQSGGTLSVSSAPGEGTCFTITLPRHEPPGEVPAMHGTVPGPACRGAGRVLLVDDDDAIRRLAERALSRAGLIVTQADCGEAALEFDVGTFDCVVSDVAMPGLDGPGLVRQLRAARPGLPSLLMSGYADAAQRLALQAEDIIFVAKPFTLADLTVAVRKMLADAAHCP